METEAHIGFDKRISGAIKGIAIILMVTHHCFGFPSWYIQGINYSNVTILGAPMDSWIRNSTQLCVSLFAFLTGWAYFFNEKRTLKYSVRKMVNFLKYYWFILFVIFIPAGVILAGYIPSANEVILNMFALKNTLISLSWYVYFYLFAMATLPVAIRIMNGGALFDFLFATAYCVLLYNLIGHVQILRDYITNGLRTCLYWYPCVLTGYLFAKHDLFSRLYKYFKHPNKLLYACTILVVMGCRLKWQTVLGLNLDVLYAPVAVFSLVMLLRDAANFVKKPLEFLGGHAMNIWFLHSIFFTVIFRPYFQSIAFLPRNPVLVVIWVILLCLPFSMAVNFIFRRQEKLFGVIRDKWSRRYDK